MYYSWGWKAYYMDIKGIYIYGDILCNLEIIILYANSYIP